MPKYCPFKIAGYYLYFTMACTVGCMHAHASDTKLTEGSDADCELQEVNCLFIYKNM